MCIQNGYGFAHFPLHELGIAGALKAVAALHQVTIHQVTYDCSVSNQLKQLIFRDPGAWEMDGCTSQQLSRVAEVTKHYLHGTAVTYPGSGHLGQLEGFDEDYDYSSQPLYQQAYPYSSVGYHLQQQQAAFLPPPPGSYSNSPSPLGHFPSQGYEDNYYCYEEPVQAAGGSVGAEWGENWSAFVPSPAGFAEQRYSPYPRHRHLYHHQQPEKVVSNHTWLSSSHAHGHDQAWAAPLELDGLAWPDATAATATASTCDDLGFRPVEDSSHTLSLLLAAAKLSDAPSSSSSEEQTTSASGCSA
jgi:hypothetical protein